MWGDSMTNDELLEQFDKDFERDCYALSCELRDCCECSTYWECFEEYKQELGFIPTTRVGL